MRTRPVSEQVRSELARRPHVTVDFAPGQSWSLTLECLPEGFQLAREQAFEKQPVEVCIGHAGIIVAGLVLTTALCRIVLERRTRPAGAALG